MAYRNYKGGRTKRPYVPKKGSHHPTTYSHATKKDKKLAYEARTISRRVNKYISHSDFNKLINKYAVREKETYKTKITQIKHDLSKQLDTLVQSRKFSPTTGLSMFSDIIKSKNLSNLKKISQSITDRFKRVDIDDVKKVIYGFGYQRMIFQSTFAKADIMFSDPQLYNSDALNTLLAINDLDIISGDSESGMEIGTLIQEAWEQFINDPSIGYDKYDKNHIKDTMKELTERYKEYPQ